MKVVLHRKIVEFYTKHPDAHYALERWYKKTLKKMWKNFPEMKDDLGSADHVGNQHYVFNIKGDGCRLVAVVQFTHGYRYIRFVGTQEEYNQIDASNI